MKKQIKYILLSILILVAGFACQQDQRKDIEAFYFPMDALESGLVYEYRPVKQDSVASDYWYFNTIKENGNTYFVGNYYDINFNVRQSFREERVASGMLTEDVRLYATDSLDKTIFIPVELEANNSFPFKVSEPSGIFLYKIKWNDPFDASISTTLIRNRRYIGDTTFVFQNKEYPCIKMELRELVENHKEGDGYAEPEYSGLELYAKGLGLVYYRRDITPDFSLEYRLWDTYSIDTLESRLR